MQGVTISRLVWYLTFSVGCYGAISAASVPDYDAMLGWLAFTGLFASLHLDARPGDKKPD